MIANISDRVVVLFLSL